MNVYRDETKIINAIVPDLSIIEVKIVFPIIETFLSRPHNIEISHFANRILSQSCLSISNENEGIENLKIIRFNRVAMFRELGMIANRIYHELGGGWYFNQIPNPPDYTLYFSTNDIIYAMIVYFLKYNIHVNFPRAKVHIYT